jgi:hypothetical protein
MRSLTACLVILLGLCGSGFGQAGKVPVIAANVSIVNQTGQIPPTVLLTPTGNSLYRVSVYFSVLTPGSQNGGNLWCVNITWTDDGQKRTKTAQVNTSTVGNYTTLVIPVRAIANQPLSYSLVGCDGIAPEPYDLLITVEQLQ